MMRNDSDCVSDLFTAGARDRTPASARHAAYVLYAPISLDPEASKCCASVLSDAELLRADRFVTEDGKAQFKQRRAFRRYCGAVVLGSPRPLSRVVFEETDKGRPYLPDLPDFWFSFSSCQFGLLGAWSATHKIGVDLEDRNRDVDTAELARMYFAEAEAKVVEGAGDMARQRTFFQHWCLKEAALKSIGEGLPFGLDAFEFELSPNLRVVHAPQDYGGPERFNAYVIEGTECCAALVTRGVA